MLDSKVMLCPFYSQKFVKIKEYLVYPTSTKKYDRANNPYHYDYRLTSTSK